MEFESDPGLEIRPSRRDSELPEFATCDRHPRRLAQRMVKEARGDIYLCQDCFNQIDHVPLPLTRHAVRYRVSAVPVALAPAGLNTIERRGPVSRRVGDRRRHDRRLGHDRRWTDVEVSAEQRRAANERRGLSRRVVELRLQGDRRTA